MKRCLQFIFLLLAARALAHAPEPKIVFPSSAHVACDAAWNLNKRTNGAAIQTFNVDGKNQMTTVPDGSCIYDLNGNLVQAKNTLHNFFWRAQYQE
jgi:NADH dehydrogenase FAD-containing subunit